MAQANPYPLRIDEAIMAKMKQLAKENGRSVNKEIEYALRRYIMARDPKNLLPKD